MFQVVWVLILNPIYIQIEFVDDDGKIVFEDGPSVHAETILYCTGYESDASLLIDLFSLVEPTFIAIAVGSLIFEWLVNELSH